MIVAPKAAETNRVSPPPPLSARDIEQTGRGGGILIGSRAYFPSIRGQALVLQDSAAFAGSAKGGVEGRGSGMRDGRTGPYSKSTSLTGRRGKEDLSAEKGLIEEEGIWSPPATPANVLWVSREARL